MIEFGSGCVPDLDQIPFDSGARLAPGLLKALVTAAHGSDHGGLAERPLASSSSDPQVAVTPMVADIRLDRRTRGLTR